MTDLEKLENEFLSQYVFASKLTQEKYKKEIDLFCKISDIKTIENFNNFDCMEKFYNFAQTHSWKDSTINQRLLSIKLFYNWGKKRKILNNPFMEDIKKIRMVNTVKYTPSFEDCEKMLKYIQDHTKKQRLYLMVKLLMFSGFRRSEICNLRLTDINNINSRIKVVGKGKKIIEQPIPRELLQEIKNYTETERLENIEKYKQLGGEDLGYIFVSGIGEKGNSNKNLLNGNKINDAVFYQQIKRYAKLSGIKNGTLISPHAFRRAIGTEVYNRTKDIKTASEFLRHSNVSTTERCYVSFNREMINETISNIFNENN